MLALCLAAPAEARKVRVTLLHTTDLHGTLIPRPDYDGNDGMGGLLRLKTLVERARAANPNTLLVDCGDFIQGSPETLRTRGAVTLTAMNHLGYDAVVLGNHEFDWGLDHLARMGEAAEFPLLGANIRFEGERAENPLPALRPYVIREVDGVRVAIVGLTTPAMPLWYLPEFTGGFRFDDAVPTLERVLPRVRAERPDVMVLITHMGLMARTERERRINQVDQVLRNAPDFDIICGGHTHRVIERYDVKNTIYSQAGYFGIRLGRIDLVYDTVTDRIESNAVRMLRVDSKVPDHPALAARLRADLDATRTFLTQEVAVAEIELTGTPDAAGESGLQALFGAALREATGCDFVFHGSLTREGGIQPGPITEQDLWRVVPYENRIGVAKLTAAEIRAILEESAAHLGRWSRMGAWGLRVEIDPEAPAGQRLRSVRKADGGALHGRKRYACAFNSHTLASSGGRYPELHRIVTRPQSRLELTKMDTREAVRRWLRKRGTLHGVPRP